MLIAIRLRIETFVGKLRLLWPDGIVVASPAFWGDAANGACSLVAGRDGCARSSQSTFQLFLFARDLSPAGIHSKPGR